MHPDLIDAARRLADALMAENAALAILDMPRAAALLPAKQAACDAFTAAQAAWPPVASKPADLRLADQLSQLAEENRRLLQRALSAQASVLRLLASAARSAQPSASYGARGRATASYGATALRRQV